VLQMGIVGRDGGWLSVAIVNLSRRFNAYIYSLFVLNQSLMQATKRPVIVGDYIFFSLLAYSVQPTFSPQAWKSVGAGIVSCRGTIVA
jgi:hypothetical protein